MRFAGTIPAFVFVGSLAACTYPRTQTSYAPSAVEAPQPVHFFNGTIVDVHRASLEYPYEAGLGIGVGLSPYLAGLHLTGAGPYGGLRITAAFVDIIPGGSVPNIEANEYTVMLNTGTNPPDPYLNQRERMAAVIVVQNELADRYPNDVGMRAGENVVVRVVGRSGRVMRDPFAPSLVAEAPPGAPAPLGVGALPGGVPDWRAAARRHLTAEAPMPIPLSGYPSYPDVPIDTRYHPHWDVPTF
jgi:hypothetical protein